MDNDFKTISCRIGSDGSNFHKELYFCLDSNLVHLGSLLNAEFFCPLVSNVSRKLKTNKQIRKTD